MNPNLNLFFCLLFTLCSMYQCRDVGEAQKANLISSACDRTLYKDLCRQTLQSDPESRAATDIGVLAKVALQHALSQAKQIQGQLSKQNDKSVAFKDCNENYDGASERLQDSVTSFKSKKYSDVLTWVSAAMSNSDSCEDGLKEMGKASPILGLSTTFSQLCSIVLALTNQLAGH
ncbi:putative invertase inhibitor [Juglans microcarpa x Juglans regia]|uniref:putative invertase inhibitor n=1 Tax=Juglans microcarpa x Juglans regia TaxID=2249226 RepID=UPI001B7F28D0|nr:putative invertase inhibitor [Juglans microcarpa x Juglans regia]